MRRTKDSLKCAVLLAVVLPLSLAAKAQTYLDSTGSPTFTTAFPVEYGFINLSNGNLHLEIPLASYPQRGKLSYTAKMVYDSRIWTPANLGSGVKWYPINVPGSQGGWRYIDPGDVGITDYVYTYDSQGCWVYDHYVYTESFSGFTWTDPGGTVHSFGNFTYNNDINYCGGGHLSESTSAATDGSGYVMKVTNYSDIVSVTAKDGTQVYPSLKDTNGNYFSVSGINTVDTLGRTLVTRPTSGSTYSYLKPVSGTAGISIVTKSISPSTSFSQTGVSEYPGGNITVIDYIELANGLRYTFGYASTGELNSITPPVPSGSAITYDYDVVTDVNGDVNLWVSERVSAGGTWTFTAGSECSSTCPTMLVHTPSGDETKYTFNFAQGSPWNTEVTSYTGTALTGDLLFTKTLAYDTSSTAVAVTSETTTVSSIKKKTSYSYDNAGARNLTSVKEWDWIASGNSFGATPERETTTSYITGSAYVAKNILNLPSSVTIYGSGTSVAQTNFTYDGGALTGTSSVTGHDYTNYSTSNTIRGNPTTISRWKSGGSYVSSTMTYNDLGNVLTTTDPGGHTTTISYSAANQQAYPTEVNLPDTNNGSTIHHKSQAVYDFNTGLVLSTCGENYSGTCTNSTTNGADQVTYTYDDLLRPTHTYIGDGGQSDFYYPTSLSNTSRVQRKIDGSNWTDQWTLYDTYGRASQTLSDNGESGNYRDVSAICYDTSGRVTKTTYPVQGTTWLSSGCTGNGDTYAYDGLNRITAVNHSSPPSTSVTYLYETITASPYHHPVVTVTDESSKQKKYITDGLGRQIAAGEVVSSSPVWTNYTFNVFDQLTGVSQGNRNSRTYMYDGLGRLLTSTQPESGTTTFTYNDDGTVATRVRPQANQTISTVTTTTTYSYDQLHRLTQTAYSHSSTPTITTPTSTRDYDQGSLYGVTLDYPVGRLTRTINDTVYVSWALYGYKKMGQVYKNWQGLPLHGASSSQLMTYDYNLLGQMTSATDGMGTTFTTSYNVGGRPTALSSTWSNPAHPSSLLTSVGYNALGQPDHYTTGDGVKTQNDYTAAGRLNYRWAKRSGGSGSDVLTQSSSSTPMTYDPNGAITAVNDHGTSRSFSYDDRDRLMSGSHTYDDYGNVHEGAVVDPISHDTNNRISSSAADVEYDAVGNITLEKVGTSSIYRYKYDAENRLKEFSINGNLLATYVYDAEGRRIKKDFSTGNGTDVEYLYDLDGRPIVELLSSNGTYNRGEIFLGGAHLATYSNSNTYFVFTDWMGTERVRTSSSNSLAQTCSWGTFGELPSCTTNTDPVGISPHGYAGYEYEKESGLHHMWFRNYNPRLGRFMTADPYDGSMNLSDPQSMNRYAYVLGNPTNYFDPLGLDCAGGATPLAGGWCPGEIYDPSLTTFKATGRAGFELPGSHGLGFDQGMVALEDLTQGELGWWGAFTSELAHNADTNALKANQCAAQLSQQSISLNPWRGNFLADTFLDNQFGGISHALLGGSPGRMRSIGQAVVDNPTKYSVVGLVTAAAKSLPAGTSTVTSIPISHMPATYNPVTVSVSARTLGMTQAARSAGIAFGLALAGKAVFDAGVYVGAIAVCSY